MTVPLVFINSFSKIISLTKKLNENAASNGSRGKYTKCYSFPWPPVVAVHDIMRFGRALIRNGDYWLQKKLPLAPGRGCVHQILPFHSECIEDDLRSKWRLV